VDHGYGWENLAGDAGEYLAQCTTQPGKTKECFLPTAIYTQQKQKQASGLVGAEVSREFITCRGIKMKIMVVDICCKMWWGQD